MQVMYPGNEPNTIAGRAQQRAYMNPYCFPEQKPILFVGIEQEQQDWDVEMSAIEDTAVDAIEQYMFISK